MNNPNWLLEKDPKKRRRRPFAEIWSPTNCSDGLDAKAIRNHKKRVRKFRFSAFRVSACFVWVATWISLTGCHGERQPSTFEHPEAAVVQIGGALSFHGRLTQGSGFCVSADGLIVTCLHLIDPSEATTLIASDGRKLQAEFIAEDQSADVAVLRVHGDQFPFLRLHDDDFDPGSAIRVAGAASINRGLFDHWETVGKEIDFTARITPAEVGAPLLADDGTVVGVVHGAVAGKEGEYVATPIWHVIRLMPKLGR